MNVILYIIYTIVSPALCILVNCAHLYNPEKLFTFVKLKL